MSTIEYQWEGIIIIGLGILHFINSLYYLHHEIPVKSNMRKKYIRDVILLAGALVFLGIYML